MTDFDAIITEINKALRASQGADRSVEYTTKDGRNVRVSAFVAGGSVRPGSFRSTWWIDGEKMNKETARKALQGKA